MVFPFYFNVVLEISDFVVVSEHTDKMVIMMPCLQQSKILLSHIANNDPKYYKIRGTSRRPMLSMIDTRDKRAVDA